MSPAPRAGRRGSRPGLAPAIALGASLLAGAAPLARHNAEGPPPGHTGGFGEPTCQVCHQAEPLNAPGGSLSVSGLPERWEPDRTYELVVRLVRPDLARGGFQLAVRFAEGADAGRQAGRLEAVDGRVAVSVEPATGINYAQHTWEGTTIATPGAARWLVRWRAPSVQAGAVVLDAAANAANDDNSPLGDFIYTGAWTARGSTP